jgi:hypothetical protein
MKTCPSFVGSPPRSRQTPAEILHFANTLRDQWHYKDAALLYGQLLGQSGATEETCLSLATCLHALGDDEGARAALGIVLGLNESNHTARSRLASLPTNRPSSPSHATPDDEARLTARLDELLTNKLHDAEFVSWKLATESTARYINAHMHAARVFTSPRASKRHDPEGRNALLEFALNAATLEGLVAEFGVHKGESVRLIASLLPPTQVVHGFDSFVGLPEGWFHGRVPGHFSLDGTAPACGERVVLHKGWFSETLPPFLAANPGPFRFVHIDSDIYSSARDILTLARDRFIPGTIILFDEYFNYPGWEQHEQRAFHEFIRETGLGYDYLGMAPRHYSVAVRLR